jgi:DnaJ-class molecular chaperone
MMLRNCPSCRGHGRGKHFDMCFRCRGTGIVDRSPLTRADQRRLIESVSQQLAMHGLGVETAHKRRVA